MPRFSRATWTAIAVGWLLLCAASAFLWRPTTEVERAAIAKRERDEEAAEAQRREFAERDERVAAQRHLDEAERQRAAARARPSLAELLKREDIELRASSSISAKCDRRWPGDERMRSHCWRDEQDAKEGVIKILELARGNMAAEDAIAACLSERVGADFFKAEWRSALYCANDALDEHH